MSAFAHVSGFKTLVYVEDHEINVLLMQALLRQRPGLHLVVATSGAQAWELTTGLEPAALLLDIRLPDCTGTELLLRLRQHPGCRNAPAVAVTAEHDFSLHGTGFVDLWTKPLRFEHVLTRLDALIGGQTALPPAAERARYQEPASAPQPRWR